ncbi:hypothetical protein [Reyranella sp.]|uniref:AAA family ATPase n=1 Tax=Reyranella sp. TaxID=1929291 RepID=UPI003D0D20FC
MIPVALNFSRYRAFREESRVELAPLTLIIGKNGGGKSVLTRLPLLLASGLSSVAEAPLNLTAGGITHATRYEDLIFLRSGLPFSLGAEISDGSTTLRFKTTLQHIVEQHALGIVAFELQKNGENVVAMNLSTLEDLGKPTANFQVRFASGSATENQVGIIGIFPAEIFGQQERTAELLDARSYFEKAFNRPSYLGPFRAEQGSLSRMPHQGVKDLGPRGERSLDLVGDDALRGNGDLVRAVASWFETNLGGNRVDLVHEGFPRIMVYDALRKISVDLVDTGVGFAQVLPIVVQALARQSGKLQSPFIIVEQPELHLHPAAHGGVADLIIATVKKCGSGLRYFCETHSEQIISRIRRRVAEGILPPESVKIVSVGHQASANDPIESLRTIHIDKLGNLDSWPIGVFEEAFDDLVHQREAIRRKQSAEQAAPGAYTS